MTFVPPKYDTKSTDFFKALKTRTDAYFARNQKEKHGNFGMYFKTFVMLSCYLTPYFFVLFGEIENPWIYSGLWAIMGLFMSGIGLSIMHDAIHGSFSKNKTVNLLFENEP